MVSKGRVVVAMSGGVDSSVAALVLHQAGYEVVGVTLRLWTPEQPEKRTNKRCCSVEDVDDARRVCQTLGVRHYVINAEREFSTFVVDYFTREYQIGRTPHPCIACNDRIKFDFLLERALALNADYIATGHHARVLVDQTGEAHLLRSVDMSKDQSYVLFGLAQHQLARILLPIGDRSKEEVRSLARRNNLVVAEKPDSQDICFIPSGGYREFLANRLTPTPGQIVDLDGKVLGRHQGVEFYTVGQRRGLGIQSEVPLYVVAIEPDTQSVVVGPEAALYQPTLCASKVNWLAGHSPEGEFEATVKIRYKASEIPASLVAHGDCVEVRFSEPQRAVTPGQAVVFYCGDEVMGGGYIDANTLGPNTNRVGSVKQIGCENDFRNPVDVLQPSRRW